METRSPEDPSEKWRAITAVSAHGAQQMIDFSRSVVEAIGAIDEMKPGDPAPDRDAPLRKPHQPYPGSQPEFSRKKHRRA